MKHGRSRIGTALALVVVLGVSLGVVACGSSSNSSSNASNSSSSSGGSGSSTSGGGNSPQAPSGTIKMAAALIGPKNDGSFGQSTYEGAQAALKQFSNLKLTSVLENETTDTQRTDGIDTLSPLNNVVLAVSSSYGPILDNEAAKFPNTYFINIAGAPDKFAPNVTGFNNDWGAPAYVGGVIAAHMTKTKVVGYVGGAQIPPTTQAAAAFAAGAKSVDPSIKVLSTITGDFNNVSEAKAATTSQIDANADVIFPFLDAGIAGAYQAGTQSGKNPAMFKLTIPDCGAYPNMVGTEVVNDKAAAQALISAYVNHKIKPGAIMLDLQNPKMQTLALCPKYQSNPMVAKVTKQTIAAINSGKIKLPASAINPRPTYPYINGIPGAS
ncbi:MAG TPA: BMP family ABC transporter substrate-binding protein [Solirubrobacteraceae bacterium]|jgi:basic membrane protein A